jgi:hypothetical protein
VPATGSKKIDTVGAELLPRNAGLPAFLILGAGSSVSSGIPLWGRLPATGFGLAEWTQAAE